MFGQPPAKKIKKKTLGQFFLKKIHETGFFSYEKKKKKIFGPTTNLSK